MTHHDRSCLRAKLDSYVLRCFQDGEVPRVKEFAQIHDIDAGRINPVLGAAPGGYIRAVQLAHVEKYLLRTSLTLFEIAQLTGFASPHGLFRLFRLSHGCTPEQWRRDMRPGWRQRHSPEGPASK